MSAIGTVTVHLVVKVEVKGTWGGDCTLEQIRKQGTTEAVNSLSRTLADKGVAIIKVDAREVVVSESGVSR